MIGFYDLRRLAVLGGLLALTYLGTAQSLYWVQFSDKVGSPYGIEQADRFLSAAALQRRARHGQAVTEQDLPLSTDYLGATAATGARIWLRSRWLNGVTIIADEATLARVQALPFVDTTYFTGPAAAPEYQRSRGTQALPGALLPPPDSAGRVYYGASYANIAKLRGDSLLGRGYRGQGITVAVLDGGFPLVNYKEFLGYESDDALPLGFDLVEQDGFAFDGSAHGSTVLSVMAARHPFILMGTAPEATYICIKTENTRGEYRQEEINWAVGLEIADSLGADVVNSSLGYTTFTDQRMNYAHANLDGRTSPASRAADLAYARGMIVVNSAGNEGGGDWRLIGIPADAAGVVAVGAIDSDGQRAFFSSFGPSADGRVKPDLVAPGVRVPAISTTGSGLGLSSGTSLAAPLISGLIASLWQAFPERSNADILDAVRRSCDRYAQPSPDYGYGLPDFAKAYRLLAAQTAPAPAN